MDEEQTVKQALKLEYVKEIVNKWIDNGKLDRDDVRVDEKGRIIIETNPRALVSVLTDLAYEFAETKAEFWCKTNVQKDNENKGRKYVSTTPL
jgi:hypothetical protein